jgi:alpha-D-ribose 1-methylphosphonate 5-triphosphate synthase subunit PhnG
MRRRFSNLGTDLDIFMTNQPDGVAERKHWLAVLARASRTELEEAAARQLPLPPTQLMRPPETGMVMLRGRVGGTGEAFNLGEATVTRCALRVADALGVGYALGRDRRKAELIALLDALLQDGGRRERLLREVVEPMQRRQAAARDAASGAAASSRVEFFTMVRGEA